MTEKCKKSAEATAEVTTHVMADEMMAKTGEKEDLPKCALAKLNKAANNAAKIFAKRTVKEKASLTESSHTTYMPLLMCTYTM